MSGANSDNEYLPAYVQTDVTHISLALCVLGFYLVTINQLSYYLKSKLFMSNALIALCVGIGTSRRAPVPPRCRPAVHRSLTDLTSAPRACSGRANRTRLGVAVAVDELRRRSEVQPHVSGHASRHRHPQVLSRRPAVKTSELTYQGCHAR